MARSQKKPRLQEASGAGQSVKSEPVEDDVSCVAREDATADEEDDDSHDESSCSVHTLEDKGSKSSLDGQSDREEVNVEDGCQHRNDANVSYMDFAFCCHVCRCKQDSKSTVVSRCHSDDGGYWHKHCCHNITTDCVDEDWMPPLEKCFKKVAKEFEKLDSDESSSDDHDDDSENEEIDVKPERLILNVKDTRQAAETDELAIEKDIEGNAPARRTTVNVSTAIDGFATLNCKISHKERLKKYRSTPGYREFCSKFHRCMKRRQAKRQKAGMKKPKANVLDLFCGVGSGLLALKRLGVAIDRYTHVDHDRGATFVLNYNRKGGNGVAEVDCLNCFDYSDFSDVESNLDEVLHEPIDIILAAPPCDAENTNDPNEKERGVDTYLLRTMQLIDAIKGHPKQRGRAVFVMVENVVLKDEVRHSADQAFGCPPILLDAKDFSPCRRRRHYWVNYPLDEYDFSGPQAKSVPILEDDWIMLSGPEAKANTFMPSKSLLDDHPRMAKVRRVKRRLKGGTYSLKEREWMMGFPEGYFSAPIKILYQELLEALGARSLEHVRWQEKLDENLWEFSGVNYYKFHVSGSRENAKVVMQMAPHTPLMRKGAHFSEEEMGKHLLGNSHSIPLLEYVLRPLTKLFAKRAYGGADYEFRWSKDEPT